MDLCNFKILPAIGLGIRFSRLVCLLDCPFRIQFNPKDSQNTEHVSDILRVSFNCWSCVFILVSAGMLIYINLLRELSINL